MRTIKKYSNRRLYDTVRSRYVNLEELAAIIRAGDEVQIVDAKTGDDLTRGVLLQVVMEARGGAALFPTGFLHRIIRHSGDSPMHRAALQQIAAGMEMIDAQIGRLERQFSWMRPSGPDAPEAPPAEPPPAEAAPEAPSSAPEPAAGGDEMDALRARLEALEERLKG